MYLHIGGKKIVRQEDIIAVLDLETTSMSKKTREFLKLSDRKKEVINVSEEIPRTYIVCSEKGKNKVYISQISSQTLYRRAERNESIGTEN